MNINVCFLFILFFNNASSKLITYNNLNMDSREFFNKLFGNFKIPEEVPEDLDKIIKLPRNIHPVILGNIEYLPTDTREKVFGFYDTCTICQNTLALVTKIEEQIVKDILFSWRLTGDTTKLDNTLKEHMTQCFQKALCENSETIQKADPNAILLESLKQLSSSIFPQNSVEKPLPRTAGVRILMMQKILGPFKPSVEPRYSRLYHNYSQQIIEVVRNYLKKPNSDNETKLTNRMRQMFFRIFLWVEQMFVGSVVSVVTASNTYHPNNMNLPSLDKIISHIPDNEKIAFVGRWKVLMNILNFPAAISPVIIGNIHLIPQYNVNDFFDTIEQYRQDSRSREEFISREIKYTKQILQYKYNLYYLWDKQLIIKFKKTNEECEGNCGNSKQNYEKIGDKIECTYLSQEKPPSTKKKETLQVILQEGQYDSPQLHRIISGLPVQLCICVSIQQINIQKLPNKLYKKNLHERLIKIIWTYLDTNETEWQTYTKLINIFQDIKSIMEKRFLKEFTEHNLKENSSDTKKELDDEVTSKRFKRPNELANQDYDQEMNSKKVKEEVEFTRQDSTTTADSTNDGQIDNPPQPPIQVLPVMYEDKYKPVVKNMEIDQNGLNLELSL